MDSKVVIISLCFWTLIEWLWPKKKYSNAKKEMTEDFFWAAFYEYIIPLLSTVALLEFIYNIGPHIPVIFDIPIQNWTLKLIFFILLSDFLNYCVHRLIHTNSSLWEIHKLHHSTVELRAISSARGSWLEDLFAKIFLSIPLAALGAPVDILNILVLINAVFGHYLHSNLKISLPKYMNKLICTAEFHRWHHAKELLLEKGQNFGIIFPMWDILFKTAVFPNTDASEFGLDSQEKFPTAFIGRFFYPLNKILKYNFRNK